MSAHFEWSVQDGKLVLPSGNTMQSSCHHRQGSACGGCYARAVGAMDRMAELVADGNATEAIALYGRVCAAMRRDGEVKRKKATP